MAKIPMGILGALIGSLGPVTTMQTMSFNEARAARRVLII